MTSGLFWLISSALLLPCVDGWCFLFFCTTDEKPKPEVPQPTEGCGVTPVRPQEARIVGGTPAVPYSWPWQAAVCTKRTKTTSETLPNGETIFHEEEICELRCGGSLIDREWIMTAGHCVAGTINRPYKIGVKLGVYDHHDTEESGSILMNVKEVFRHSDWGYPHMYSNDIALLHLAKPVNYTNHIRPVCLPSNVTSLIQHGASAFVTGWGSTTDGEGDSSRLRQVSVSFLSMKICKKEYGEDIDSTMECASKPGHDSCHGDSGGPLVTKFEDGRWYQAGIVVRKHEGVYARTSSFCDFIKEHVGHQLCTN